MREHDGLTVSAASVATLVVGVAVLQHGENSGGAGLQGCRSR